MVDVVKIMTICGCGVGSSILFGLNVKKVVEDRGYKCDLTQSDVTTAKSWKGDIILNQPAWMGALRGMPKENYKVCGVIYNIVSKGETGIKLPKIMDDLGYTPKK